ncbi:MAG: excinuclease ABC subunit UvrA [Gemmatimonadota bacterium]
MNDAIRIQGARQHNLKGIDLEIPRRALTALTGPSGSGKSSLAFDTIYAEGQRRYIESLSTYAKQFLERMPRPAVERIDGVSPSVAIDQKNSMRSSRSTVGTVTEVYDYMRLLWARVGTTVCPDCRREVVPDSVGSATDAILAWGPGTRVYVAFPFHLSESITDRMAVANLQAQGYLRVIADGRELYLPDLLPEHRPEDGNMPADGDAPGRPDRTTASGLEPALVGATELLVVVDRLVLESDSAGRLADSLAAAFAEGEGHAVALRSEETEPAGRRMRRTSFTEAFACSECGRGFPRPQPTLFSFNSPAGACPECTGFGATLEYDLDLIVPDPGRSLDEGAIDPWTKPRYRRQRAALRDYARREGIDTRCPWRDLPEGVRERLLYGASGFEGVLSFLRGRERKRYKQYIRVFLRQYQKPHPCRGCGGTRLREEARHVRVGGLDIASAAALPIFSLREWLDRLELPPFRARIAESILRELADRLRFLDEVGLGHLTVDRQARTLSGGEMQRIRLASCLGGRLVDALYVLDEPTIGLHPLDVDRFVDVLWRLKDRGNTVLVVEHEPRVLERADHIVELGPGSGQEGGEVVFEGDWQALRRADTATGRALAARGRLGAPRRGRPVADGAAGRPGRGSARRPPRGRGAAGGWLALRGASLRNIRDLDVDIPLGALTTVTGVSGSGKSTLVHDILFYALEGELGGASSAREHLGESPGSYRELRGLAGLRAVTLIDQSPIGRTSRSNPVTYIKAFDEIRKAFAEQPLARRRGYGAGHFSFNIAGGRCEACKGAGEEIVEMVFMADVAVPCEACRGTRYRPEILEVEYRGRSIGQVLDLTVDQAIGFFVRRDRLGQALWQLQRVGLGYLRLGQPATTLSGGEAQRLKIARELARGGGAGRRLYILDEPTVGLGLGEIGRLMGVLRQLVDEGHTVVVVEHNLDVIAQADWVIDLGPGPAQEGGRIVAAGSPGQIMRAPASHTGTYLRRHFEELGRDAAAAGRQA